MKREYGLMRLLAGGVLKDEVKIDLIMIYPETIVLRLIRYDEVIERLVMR
jgi:hypothetical protein